MIYEFNFGMSLRIFCNEFTQLFVAELSVRKFEDVYICLGKLLYEVVLK
jgi:hypothetical protein